MDAVDRLVTWFRGAARTLPWRTSPRGPYRSLVAELMAQQTQLERVVPRFEAFISRFPTLADLAAATTDEVLELWSGLGYYRRARLLHALARQVEAGTGVLPTTASELERLPGVGPYTAAAVASMVYGEPVPLMDGNVARVAARVLAISDDPRSGSGRAAVLGWVAGLMDGQHPGVVNEALMELGALICRPLEPDCGGCPLRDECRVHQEGRRVRDYPRARRARAPVELRWVAAVVVDASGRWLLSEVVDGPVLRGLWLPPFAEIGVSDPVERRVLDLIPFEVQTSIEVFAPVRHSITYRRIDVVPAAIRIDGRMELSDRWAWADPAAPRLPTSSLLGKLRAVVG